MFSHDYNQGLKLMEHSYINNKFVSSVESLLIPGGEWYKQPIVWAGDYAENEPKLKYNLCSLCKDSDKVQPQIEITPEDYPYVVNHTKREYVDKTKIPAHDGWRIHPLPLLTAEGNGQGGGDFRGDDPRELIGSWARHSISVESVIPEGYKELKFNLIE